MVSTSHRRDEWGMEVDNLSRRPRQPPARAFVPSSLLEARCQRRMRWEPQHGCALIMPRLTIAGTGPGCPWLSLHPACKAGRTMPTQTQTPCLAEQKSTRANPRPLGSGESRPELHFPHPFSTSLAWRVCIHIHASKRGAVRENNHPWLAHALMDGVWP